MPALLGAKIGKNQEPTKYFGHFLHFYIPHTLAERATRAVRALCGRCAGAERTHAHARRINGAAVLPSGCGRAQRVPQPKRGAGGGRSDTGVDGAQRGTKSTQARPLQANSRREASRAHAGAPKHPGNDHDSKPEGLAPGAPRQMGGEGHPFRGAKVPLRGCVWRFHGRSGQKSHCRTTLRQGRRGGHSRGFTDVKPLGLHR